MSETLEETLRRLKDERDEADRRYNEALTRLDRSIKPFSDLPAPARAFDEHQLAALNGAWNTMPGAAAASPVKRTLAAAVRRIVAPFLRRQVTFNSLVVDHLNRQVAAGREARAAAEALVRETRERFAALAEFQSLLMQYLQQITAYVDTKDRETAGGQLVLNAAISGAAEGFDKRWESLAARDRRFEARTAALEEAERELRGLVGIAQQATLTLKRELERVLAAAPAGAADAPAPAARPGNGDGGAFAPALDAYKYVGFEDQFRGPREEIRARLGTYLAFFAGASDVLDVGCGRGEFLELLSAAGIRARGIDLNHEMAESCRARGLDVTEADAVGYLSALPDESLGGIFAAQVVEHLEPAYLLRLLELARHKLRPGGRLVLETLNPACWVAFFESYIRDITHVWPLHPETLKYLVLASGFTRADIEWRSPVPAEDRLQPVAFADGIDSRLAEVVEAFNANVEKLNARMFTYLDYAVVGSR